MTGLHDTHDRLERLLQEDGVRWRGGYAPPSLDDAVRRLSRHGDEAVTAGEPAGTDAPTPVVAASSRWRALGVAATVVLLVGGVVGAVRASRDGHDRVAASGAPSSVTARPSTAPSTPPAASVGPSMTGLPAGFASAPAPVRAGLLTPVRNYERTLPRGSGATEAESIGLLLGTGSPPPELPSLANLDGRRTRTRTVTQAVVRGHPAEVREIHSSGPGSAGTNVVVTWSEHGHWVQVGYTGPGVDDAQGPPLTAAQVVAVAAGFQPGPDPWPTSPFVRFLKGPSSLLPFTVERDGRRLVAWQVEPLGRVALSGDGRSLVVRVRQAPTTTPTYCAPYAVPLVTSWAARGVLMGDGSTTGEVEITIGLYADAVPSVVHPCPSPLPATRDVVVSLTDVGPRLDGRPVYDGATGTKVALATGR